MDKTSIKRVERAVELFSLGYNCSQSVSAAWADAYGFTEEQMLKLSASFGGGIGRMRMTCGAACGMFILAGLETGSAIEHDAKGKERNYALVQCLANEFKRRNGSLICAELLSGKGITPTMESKPEERTEAYYKKRPCAMMVRVAAEIWLDYLNGKLNQ